jgi:hypothetical protein
VVLRFRVVRLDEFHKMISLCTPVRVTTGLGRLVPLRPWASQVSVPAQEGVKANKTSCVSSVHLANQAKIEGSPAAAPPY